MNTLVWLLALVGLLTVVGIGWLLVSTWLALQHEYRLALQRALIRRAVDHQIDDISEAAMRDMLAKVQRER